MPKESYDTIAKRKVIEQQGNLIRDYLIKKHRKKPEDLRVAFFPGAEALEYKLVYEPLGILQQNITAVERNKSNFEYWKGNSSFCMTDKPIDAFSFVKKYQGPPFDIISLDYDGMLSMETERTMDYIAGRQLLNEKSILAVNLYAKRENDISKWLYTTSIKGTAWGITANPYWKKGFDSLKFLDQQNRNFDRDTFKEVIKGEKDPSKTRDLGITLSILSALEGGKSLIEITPLYRRSSKFEERDRRVVDFIKKKATPEELETWGFEELRATFHHGMANFEFLKELTDYLDKKGHLPVLSFMLLQMDRGIYHPQGIYSFKYTSDNGAIMFSDLFALDQKKDITKKYQRLYETALTPNCPEGIGSKNHALLILQLGQAKSFRQSYKAYQKRVLDDIQNLCPKNKNCNFENFPPRVDLGSSQRPMIRSKAKLREIVQSGISKEEIEEKYRLNDEMQNTLPALIAHRTMGTYTKPIETKPEKLEEKIENNNKEKPNNHQSYFLIPHREYVRLSENNKISENKRLRMKYFKDETRNLSEERKKRLYNSIVESGWYHSLRSDTLDMKVYSFFDDLMLSCQGKKRILETEKIKNIWDDIRKTDKLYESIQVPESKPWPKEKKRKLTESDRQEAQEYIEAGFSNRDIAEALGVDTRQIGAINAWRTMREKGIKPTEKKTIKQEDPINEQIFNDLLAGKKDDEVMVKYNIPKTKLAGKKMMLTKQGRW